ncbi:hypothetical protein [Flavobacterium daejeonense]|uniref:hypothetical protein n=1 Tax=Flavobacterium daejeonense TaxID=350893 RepID=UPI00047B1C94|nr:hypothetical protein [Flavobacterium daejeonense]
MEYFISKSLLNDLAKINACSEMCSNKITELFSYKNKKYIVIGSISSGAKGVSLVNAYEVVLLKNYKGKAVSYAQHGFDVLDGKAERGYTGITFKCKKVDWVIIGESIDFLPIPENTQLEFF